MKTKQSRADKMAEKWLHADALLRLLLSGKARFEPATKEFCFGGIRYSVHDYDWSAIVRLIGYDKICAALRPGSEP